jgi:hypothetical protein
MPIDETSRILLSEDSWLATALEEYKALRAEVIATMGTQHTILGFGIATLGLVIGAGLSLESRASVLTFGLIFTLFVPLFSAVVVTIWWGEVLRMIRAGHALAFFEQTINDHGATAGWSGPALGWELALRECVDPEVGPRRRMWRVHVLNLGGIYGVFSLIAVIGIAMGLIKDFEGDHAFRPLLLILGGLSIALGAAVLLFANHQLKASEERWGSMKSWLENRTVGRKDG